VKFSGARGHCLLAGKHFQAQAPLSVSQQKISGSALENPRGANIFAMSGGGR